MKKYLILIFFTICITGCTKFLEEEPKGLVVGDAALSSQKGLESALAGVYASLMKGWSMGFASSAQICLSAGGDDITTHPGLNKEEFRQFDGFAVVDLNSRLQEVWAGCFKCIQSSNNIIKNYSNVTGDAEKIKAIAGEAYFFRAMAYYYLVRWWGKVPVLTDPSFSPDMLQAKSNEITEVYKFIEESLIEAEKMVPDKKPEPGRINKGTVKAYLADVYLTQAGWPVKDQSKAAQAAAKAKEVIDNKAAYGFGLHPDFFKMMAGNTPEDVLALMTNYYNTSNHYYGAAATPGDEGGWDDYFAEINFFNSFPEGTRKNATFKTSVKKSDGSVILWQNFATGHPYYQKFRAQQKDSTEWRTGMPIILMRYANVLLVYAEAQARSAGAPNSLAYDAVNSVRARAGLSPLPAGLSGNDFIKAVLQERAWEFAGEWHRWFDLVRTETVKEANSNRHAREIPLRGDPGDTKNWLFPVPGSDKSKNPNL